MQSYVGPWGALGSMGASRSVTDEIRPSSVHSGSSAVRSGRQPPPLPRQPLVASPLNMRVISRKNRIWSREPTHGNCTDASQSIYYAAGPLNGLPCKSNQTHRQQPRHVSMLAGLYGNRVVRRARRLFSRTKVSEGTEAEHPMRDRTPGSHPRARKSKAGPDLACFQQPALVFMQVLHRPPLLPRS